MEERPGVGYARIMPEDTVSPRAPAQVVIAGGGVAALEALIALRDLAGERLRITLAAPAPDFVYRAMSVAEPFDLGEARRYPLREIAADFDASVVPASVVAVDAPGAPRHLRQRRDPPLRPARARAGRPHHRGLRECHQLRPAGRGRRDARAAGAPEAARRPAGGLHRADPRRLEPPALRARADDRRGPARSQRIDDADPVSSITPEPRPLDVFGDRPSAMVASLLAPRASNSSAAPTPTWSAGSSASGPTAGRCPWTPSSRCRSSAAPS